MKRTIKFFETRLLCGMMSVLFCASMLCGFAVAFDISAGGAVLMEMNTHRILYEKNAHKKLPMASTTKVMTGLLAVEHGGFNEIVTVPKQASGVEGSSMYLEVGEKITFENLVYGLMIASGNDAAVAIALHVGGTMEHFVDMMNEKAQAIGANDTHFCNPNGLPCNNHYTTAFDLALIASYAMQNPVFRKVVSTKERAMDWGGHEWDRVLRSKNKILLQYSGGNGIKTGFTKAAGKCLVSGAERNGMQLVGVVLNCGDMFRQSMAMLDYGFSSVTPTVVLQKGQPLGEIEIEKGIVPLLEVSVKNDIILPLKEGEAGFITTKILPEKKLTAPVTNGQSAGKVEIFLNGERVARAELVVNADVPAADYKYFLDKIIRSWSSPAS